MMASISGENESIILEGAAALQRILKVSESKKIPDHLERVSKIKKDLSVAIERFKDAGLNVTVHITSLLLEQVELSTRNIEHVERAGFDYRRLKKLVRVILKRVDHIKPDEKRTKNTIRD